MLRNIYTVCLTAGGLLTLLTFLFGNLLDFDFDFDFDFDLPSFVLPLKPITIVAFVAVFGGVGLITHDYVSPPLSAGIALIAAAAVSLLIYYLVYVKLRKYEAFALSEEDTYMTRAEVVERIAPGGYGKISFVLNGNTISGAAMEQKSGGGIDKGKHVFIVDNRDNIYFVCEDLEI